MKLSRKILCLFTVMALSFLMAIMIMPMSKASASTEAPTVDSFVTVDAASIRVQTPYGIRFRTEISVEDYGKIVEFAGGDATAVTFGTLIARGNDVAKLKDKDFAVESTVWDTKENPTATETGKYAYNLVIKDLSDDNLNDQYIALGYYEVNGTKYYANDYAVKTPLQVATKYAATFGAIDTNMPDQAYTLDIINKAMDGKTIAFKNATETVKYNEEFAPVILMDGVEITATEYRFDDESIAGMTANGAVKGFKGGETTITAVVKGFDGENVTEITCTATINVTKNTATPLVKADGTLALNTNGQETTISIDGEEISATQTADTFNVVDYILDKAAPAASKEYTISVSSEGYEGSVKHTLIPVGNADFKTTLKTATKDNMASRTYFLTEDVALTTADFSKSHNSMNWYSVFTNNYSNLDGRGHEISYVIVDESAFTFNNPNLGGIALGRHATWQNIYFDINIENATGGALVSDNWATIMSDNPDAAIINCYFDIDIAAANTSNFSLFGASTGLIKNNVFNVSAPAGITVYFAENGTAKTTPNFVNNVLIFDKASYQMFPAVYGNKTTSGNVRYTTMDAFIEGGNYYNIGNVNYSDATFVEVESPVYNYKGWDVDKDAKTIKLDDKVVYGTAVKAALAVTLEENVLSFANNGQLYDIFVTVDTNKQLIVENLYGTSYDLSTYLEEHGTAFVGKTVTFTVESRGYTGSVDKAFEKIDSQIAIDNRGMLTFNSGNQPVTLKINDATVENVTSPYNLASYVYEQNITQTTTYKVVIESDICTGEISHQFIPLTDSNFKSALIARISSADLSIGAHAYLTENITLEWKSGTDYGDFTHGYDSTKQVAVSVGNSNYELYVNLDGRGYSISATIDNTNGAKYIGGVFTNIAGHLYNINFDFIVKGIGAKCHSLITNGVVQGGTIENCFINVKSESSGIISLIGTVARSSYFRNSVIRFESSVADASLRVLSSGVSASSLSAPFAYVDNVILLDEGISTSTHIGDPAGGINIAFGGIISNTFIYNKTTEKSALEVFLAGGACKSVTKAFDTNQMKGMKTTDDAGGNKVSGWDNVWAFDATAGTVKLCGTTVATVPAAE